MTVDWSAVGAGVGNIAGFVAVVLLCLVGVVLSALTFSGTWLVLGATILAAWLTAAEFPGIVTVIVFALVCIAIEVADFLASAWGVQKRGGSKLAGLAAMLGGFAGMFLGSIIIPVPIIGTLLGMFAGCFTAAYLVERNRLRHHDPALHIATGAILARLAIMLLKITATLGMIAALFIGMAIA